MKLCILHVGQPRTGSSALQTYLAANAQALAAQGVLYPVLTRPAGSPEAVPWMTSYHGRAMQLVAKGVKAPRAGTFLHQLHRHIGETQHEVLLLSAEYLFKALFYNRKNLIWDYLTAAGYKIETVTYLCDQPQRLAAAYAQQCKIGRAYASFDAFCDAMQREVAPGEALEEGNLHGTLHYDSLTDATLHGWGVHHFRPYSQAVRENGVEADFMASTAEILARHGLAKGLTPQVVADFARPGRVNDMDGVLLVALCRRLVSLIKDQSGGANNQGELGRAAYLAAVKAIAGLAIVDPPYAVLTPERAAWLSGEFAATNDAFAQAVWKRPWAGVLPPPDPAGLISTDLDEDADPDVQAQFRQVLNLARPVFKEAVLAQRARRRRGET